MVETIIPLLDTLNHAELRRLRAEINLRVSADTQVDTELADFLECVSTHLGRRVLSSERQSDNIKAVLEPAFNHVTMFCRENLLKDGADRSKKFQAYQLCLKIISTGCTTVGIPVTLRTLLVQCTSISSHFESQFPGYMKAGLSQQVLR